MNRVLWALLLCACGDAPVATEVISRAMDRQFTVDAAALPDGLHLALCGAGGPLPAPHVSGPCVAVVAGDRLFVVDAGTDGLRNLTRMGYRVGTIEAVFLTHFHSDHMDGLGEMATIRWVSAANKLPLPVYGPPGVAGVVSGFNQAYALDATYRTAHHGEAVAPPSGKGMVAKPFPVPELGAVEPLVQSEHLTIEALRVDHDPVYPAVGYRFTYKDRSLLITGDTQQTDNIRDLAKGVDLLVHDALSPRLVGMMHDAAERAGDPVATKVTSDIPGYHASPKEAAETARDAGVGHLLYYHIVPPMVSRLQRPLFLDGADEVFPSATIGQDGTSFSLPAGSEEILQTSDGL